MTDNQLEVLQLIKDKGTIPFTGPELLQEHQITGGTVNSLMYSNWVEVVAEGKIPFHVGYGEYRPIPRLALKLTTYGKLTLQYESTRRTARRGDDL